MHENPISVDTDMLQLASCSIDFHDANFPILNDTLYINHDKIGS